MTLLVCAFQTGLRVRQVMLWCLVESGVYWQAQPDVDAGPVAKWNLYSVDCPMLNHPLHPCWPVRCGRFARQLGCKAELHTITRWGHGHFKQPYDLLWEALVIVRKCNFCPHWELSFLYAVILMFLLLLVRFQSGSHYFNCQFASLRRRGFSPSYSQAFFGFSWRPLDRILKKGKKKMVV